MSTLPDEARVGLRVLHLYDFLRSQVRWPMELGTSMSAMDFMDLPLSEMPRYVNDKSEFLRRAAEIRLEEGV